MQRENAGLQARLSAERMAHVATQRDARTVADHLISARELISRSVACQRATDLVSFSHARALFVISRAADDPALAEPLAGALAAAVRLREPEAETGDDQSRGCATS